MYNQIRLDILDLLEKLDLEEQQAQEQENAQDVMCVISKKLGLYEALNIIGKNVIKNQEQL